MILVSVLTFIIDLFANLLADHIPDKFPKTIFISLLFVFSLWLLAPQFIGNFSPVKNNIKIESYYEKYTPTTIKNEDFEVLKNLDIVYSYNNKPMNIQEYKNFRSTTEINELSQRMYLKNKEDFKDLKVLFKKYDIDLVPIIKNNFNYEVFAYNVFFVFSVLMYLFMIFTLIKNKTDKYKLYSH